MCEDQRRATIGGEMREQRLPQREVGAIAGGQVDDQWAAGQAQGLCQLFHRALRTATAGTM